MILLYTVAEKSATEICVTDGRTPLSLYTAHFSSGGYNKEGRKEGITSSARSKSPTWQKFHLSPCDLDVWPTDLKINRCLPNLTSFQRHKFHEILSRPSQVMPRKPNLGGRTAKFYSPLLLQIGGGQKSLK